MSKKTIIKNGRIIDPANGIDFVGDIQIENGIITSVTENTNSDQTNDMSDLSDSSSDDDSNLNCEIIDATGLVVMPGFIDVHSHFRDPGFEYKEDILTGALAAAAGGYTTVVLMCNTKPTVDNPETLDYVLNK